MQERGSVVAALTRSLIPIGIAAVVVAVDQVSKTWALNHTVQARHLLGPVTLALTFNSGAAFGLGRGATSIIEGVVAVLVGGLLIVGRRASRQAGALTLGGMGMLLGGAVGNLVDRVVRHHQGAVIDFIAALRIGTHDRWPVFNLADAAIVLGALTVAATASTRRRVAPAAPVAPADNAQSTESAAS